MSYICFCELVHVSLLLFQAMEDANLLQRFRRFVGTSAGALVAGMVAIGCTAQDIADFSLCEMTDFYKGNISDI